MKTWGLVFLVGIFFWGGAEPLAAAATPWKGYVVKTASKPGRFWYVAPTTGWKYELTTPAAFSTLIRTRAKIVSARDLKKVPVAGSTAVGDAATRAAWSGYFLRDRDHRMAAWYVYPKTRTRYRLYTATSGLALIKTLAKTITAKDFAALQNDLGIRESTRVVTTSRGAFTVTSLSLDLTTPGLRIMTDTGQTADCGGGCTTLPLAGYVGRRAAQAGIHGTYFCPMDYAACAGKTNSYFSPFYNSYSRTMINSGKIKFTTQPMVIFDTTNTPHYLLRTRQFGSVATFEATYGVKVRAAISSGPALVEAGKNVLDPGILDTKQATVKSYRGALAWKGSTVYFLVVRSATVTDSAAAMAAMGMDYAINLDGGGSTALYQGGRYIIGPGRNLPNAILISN